MGLRTCADLVELRESMLEELRGVIGGRGEKIKKLLTRCSQ